MTQMFVGFIFHTADLLPVVVLIVFWCLQLPFCVPFQHLRNTGSHVKKPFLLLVATIVIVVGMSFTTTAIITVVVVLVSVLRLLLSASS